VRREGLDHRRVRVPLLALRHRALEQRKVEFTLAKLLAQAWTGVGKAIQSYANFITGKRPELNKKSVIPGADRESNLPDPRPDDANNKAAEAAAKRQRDLAFQLFDLRNELNKRLYENEIDYAERAAEFNKQTPESLMSAIEMLAGNLGVIPNVDADRKSVV
jgi:predicted nucleic acid-binding Zn ribbon protein